jgi:thioredoxin 1
MAKEFTDANFQTEVIEASKEKPVLVDFFAPWCGPCKIQGPVVETLADEVKDWAIAGKLNTEDNQQVAASYGIMSIPTLMVFRNVEPAETMIGLQPLEGLKATLEKHK